ncbi:uncharacterized protein EKO05_0005681 [Ascochyta rabiei]|uniref:Uncharacterized protein n=1 Tax=Didymella rabiei TaxID=5454 RepID=A0A163EL15_DIDRA|nr:uncharacterized protein EKO05_0005681 [Ascochyta rabiei]KZM23749.1 hypothetical protein ST47_g5118 [Ascochyta rabiei]UPX15224.1 hypothetical protein EKO05_0005681 [Ascochyta rabiei]
MTPRTRTSNKEANFKVYYSKKVPQQVYFPHKKKAVRRPDPTEQDGADKRQMKFLPEKMRQQKVDVEDDSEDGEKKEGSTAQSTVDDEFPNPSPTNPRKDKKRRSGDAQDDPSLDSGLTNTSSKRRRHMAAPKARKPSKTRENTEVSEGPSRTLRRQSTMTQLVEGRQPSSGIEELDFKPVKRRPRASWGGASTDKDGDKKQRTLTQMIPGMGRLSKEELDELSDLDADLEDDQKDERVSQILAEQGLLGFTDPLGTTPLPLSGNTEVGFIKIQEDEVHGPSNGIHEQPPVIVQSLDNLAGGDNEQDYQPTQFIEAPARRARQMPRRMATRQLPGESLDNGRSARSRFSLLSTPEKRRVFEIPSSQSPVEFVLSTQTSPHKSNRTVLRDHYNTAALVAETPSKRRQVTFQEHAVQPVPPAPLRKFKSTIQDSEDEEGSDIENAFNAQQKAYGTDRTVDGQAVGADTQAVLNQIDQACAGADESLASDSPQCPEEIEGLALRRGAYQLSPELGESWAPVIYDDDGPEYESYQSARLEAGSQSLRDVAVLSRETLPLLDHTNEVQQKDATNDTSLSADIIPSTPPMIQLQQPDEELPSTPMVIRDESSDDEEPELGPSPPRTAQRIVPQPSSIMFQQTADLDGEPVQVPRSPSADRETQQSHSSKAEQQLQSEWLSYSQYVHARAPNSSSMHAAADAFSYNATPRLPSSGALAASTRMQYSQATTVDEVTPKKNRTQRTVSASTTPHRISKSQPFVSPDKPPSLFIPSSFPSPSRAAMEGWSSPVMGRTQNLYGSSQVLGSLEEFSIPPPPPVEDY